MIELVSLSNPKWANKTHTKIQADVQWNVTNQVATTNLLATDFEPHIQKAIERVKSGEFGEIAAYEKPSDITGEAALGFVRKERSYLLSKNVDVYTNNALRWDSLSDEQKKVIADYRTALLDITDNYSNATLTYDEDAETWNLINVEFPAEPVV